MPTLTIDIGHTFSDDALTLSLGDLFTVELANVKTDLSAAHAGNIRLQMPEPAPDANPAPLLLRVEMPNRSLQAQAVVDPQKPQFARLNLVNDELQLERSDETFFFF